MLTYFAAQLTIAAACDAPNPWAPLPRLLGATRAEARTEVTSPSEV